MSIRLLRNLCFGTVMGVSLTAMSLNFSEDATAQVVQPCFESTCFSSQPFGTLGCDNAACEDLVCAIDPFCCDISWDGLCANEALDLCVAPVAIDIKPGGCPNPLNLKSGGVISVAILGTDSFDATTIDPTTVALAGVGAVRADIEDVSTPYLASTLPGGAGDCLDEHAGSGCSNVACADLVCSTVDPFCCFFNWDSACVAAAEAVCSFDASCTDCTDEGPDGFADCVLKFNRQDLAAVLGDAPDGMCLELSVDGCTIDGTPFSGVDRVRIINR